MARVKLGNGMKVAIGRQASDGGTYSYSYLKGLVDVDLPNAVADDIDITDQDSPGQYEYQRGLIENGECVFSGMKWIPGSDTDVLLKAIKASGEVVRIRFEIEEDEMETYEGYLKSLERSAPNADKRTMSVTFKISAQVLEE